VHTEPLQPPERPYVQLSCAMSVDGCLDAPGPQRLVLSGDADLDRVDAERSEADAIMVGAGTIRRDDPRLVIRSAARRASRIGRGLPENPARVTLTASGDLDPSARFFDATSGGGPVVYCAAPQAPKLQNMLNDSAPVIAVPPPVELGAILADLSRRGVHRLLVEGGARLGREFLANGLVDELALTVAPFFVGAAAAPRFAGPGVYPHDPARPMQLVEVRQLDDVVLLRYLLGGDGPRARGEAWARPDRGDRDLQAGGFQGEPEARDRGDRGPESSGIPGRTETAGDPGAPGVGATANAADRGWLAQAIELSRRCPPSSSAFCVGAVVVAADGTVMATGYSRETSARGHAEEAALAKIDPADSRLAGATLYSSLEPCRARASRSTPCAELIITAGLRRVVIAWLEPPVFAPGGGAALLREAGITVVEVPGLAAEARAVNAAVLSAQGPAL
jgi:5-amino-6-(5-phosphoribosylamino)uracil reductase